MIKADTGHSYSEEIVKTLQQKDEKIKSLEDEVKRLKEIEKTLLKELKRKI
jgi:hypothetical protein